MLPNDLTLKHIMSRIALNKKVPVTAWVAVDLFLGRNCLDVLVGFALFAG